jgi:hypothetical protein
MLVGIGRIFLGLHDLGAAANGGMQDRKSGSKQLKHWTMRLFWSGKTANQGCCDLSFRAPQAIL